VAAEERRKHPGAAIEINDLIALDVQRIVNKWGKEKNKPPLEWRILGAGERFPDIAH
jgi:hypothetical protein